MNSLVAKQRPTTFILYILWIVFTFTIAPVVYSSMDSFHFSKALVISDVPASLPANALRLNEPCDAVDHELARQQLRDYKNALISLGLKIIEVPVDENYPDCVFTEDAVVVCGNKALMARMGHQSRRGEVDAVRNTLIKSVRTMEIFEMSEPGTFDGGDVLFTGKEFFVGLSSRTNEEGVNWLAKTFSDYPVSAIRVMEGLHLKSMMSVLGDETIIIANNDAGKHAWKEMQNKGKYRYNKVEVPDVYAANVLYINGTVVHQPIDCCESKKALDESPAPKIEINLSEFRKVDGCLTCLSVLM